MSDTITVTSTAEDITELTWEDLVLEMTEGLDDGSEHLVATSGGCSAGTCVTTYTSTTTATNP